MGKIQLDLERGEKVMNVTGRQGRQLDAEIVSAPVASGGICRSNPAADEFLHCTLAASEKDRRSGEGRHGLTGSSLRASDENLNTIRVESLKGGCFSNEGRPGDVRGGSQ